MIYIPFFIVILIDMRGVREAEREAERDTIHRTYTAVKRERTVRTQNDTQNEKRQARERKKKR